MCNSMVKAWSEADRVCFTFQEALNTGRVVKRMAFAILSAETDQYTSYLPVIQGEMGDC